MATHSILITGTSTGIGHALTEHFAASGSTVYATARRDEDLDALGRLPGVVPLRLDVRQPDQVRQAVDRVRSAGNGLHGLVHNAGVNGLGPLSTWTDQDLETVFAVNVFGVHRLTNAFLPLLFETPGRIVVVGSQGGSITGKYFGPYTMTKHALEAYCGALADEVEPHGVCVTLVQPGGVVSAMADTSHASTRKRLETAPPPLDSDARAFLQLMDSSQEPDPHAPESADNRKPSPPSIVVEAVEEALQSERPPRRMLVGTRWEGTRVIRALMDRLVDANQSGSLGFSREELIAFLDERLRRP